MPAITIRALADCDAATILSLLNEVMIRDGESSPEHLLLSPWPGHGRRRLAAFLAQDVTGDEDPETTSHCR